MEHLVVSSGHIQICIIKDYDTYLNNKKEFEGFPIILFENYANKSIALYPSKIAFQVKIPQSVDEFFDKFKSSERSSIYKRYNSIKAVYKIEVKEKIDSAEFREWIQGYKEFLGSLKDGHFTLKEEEYATIQKRHSCILLYDRTDNKLLGGALFKVININKEVRLSISLAWYVEKIRKEGAPTFVVVELIKYCIERGFSYLTFGVDTNLYGGHLSMGLHDFKKSWHAEPYIPKQAHLYGLIVNPSKLSVEKILFYQLKNNELVKTIYEKN